MEYFISKEQYQQLCAKWKESNNHSAADMLIYNILRSKDPKNGFCERKSNIQGNDPWYAFNQAKASIGGRYFSHRKYASFYGSEKTAAVKAKEAKRFKEDFGIDMPDGLHERIFQ
jgi:hypothetical protein